MFYNSFNYFQANYDRKIKLLSEKNTIGIVLCKQDLSSSLSSKIAGTKLNKVSSHLSIISNEVRRKL